MKKNAMKCLFNPTVVRVSEEQGLLYYKIKNFALTTKDLIKNKDAIRIVLQSFWRLDGNPEERMKSCFDKFPQEFPDRFI